MHIFIIVRLIVSSIMKYLQNQGDCQEGETEMLHKMGLYEEPFQSIVAGKKVIEIRLNDEKRQAVQVDDLIEFTNLSTDEQVIVRVLERQAFNDFQSLYENVSLEQIDCIGWTMNDLLKATYTIYSRESEKQFGALALTIERDL